MKKPAINLEKLEPFFDKLSKLTRLQRILICVATFIFIVGPFVYFSFLPKYRKIADLEKTLYNEKKQLEIVKKKASVLPEYERKLKNTEGQFNLAKKALPETEEIPSLLTNISSAGRTSGLDFSLFEPKAEKAEGFYATIPVDLRFSGYYHDIVAFYDKVSRLPRIVNIKNIIMSSSEKEEKLNTQCYAFTYKFIEAAPKKERPKKKK